jgi:xylose isomerase
MAALAVALAVVRVEAARHAAALSRPLDIPLLHAAIRSADLLLQHLSNLDTLVRSLSAVEQVIPARFFETIGLEALDE